MLRRFLVIVSTFLMAQLAIASEHPLTNIIGTQIDLKAYDHAIAGSIKDFVVFGHTNEETFSSELTLKREGQLIKASFQKAGGQLVGNIERTVNGQSTSTEIALVSIDPQNAVITIAVNKKLVAVKVTADGFSNGHFQNPTYKAEINGETVSFTLHNGKACYGFSSHLVLMILGAYLS